MTIIQRHITLPAKTRGFHIITQDIEDAVPEVQRMHVGIANIFIQHTSASLSINENADPTVRQDFEAHFNRMVPEDASLYRHTFEGLDDMTSHIKASLLGSSLSLPVSKGRFALGTWQGIYLCEHRNQGGRRKLVITLMGEFAAE